MMTMGAKTMGKETQKFNQAVNLFIGMNPNPDKKLWILLMLYLGKERSLHIVDNTTIEKLAENELGRESFGHIMAELSIENLNDNKKKEQWLKDGISHLFAWADTPSSLDCTLDELVHGLDATHTNQYNDNKQDVFSSHRWESTYLMEIAETFASLSETWYEENGVEAFDYILKKMYPAMSEIYQPNEITELVGYLLNAQEGSVCNPYAGSGSYANIIGEKCTYLGLESSSTGSDICKLFLQFNRKNNATVQTCDISEMLKDDNLIHDYFVSSPPFGFRIDNSEFKSAELLYLAKSSQHARCKSVGVYASSICFNSHNSTKQVIASLVEKDVLETVILLPGNIYPGTAIETAVIVVNKNKDNAGIVRFVDARDCYISEGRNKRLDLEAIFDKLVKTTNENGVSLVPNEEIRNNGYIIYPKFYSSINSETFPEGYIVEELSHIIEPCPSTRSYQEVSGHLARPASLSNDSLDYECTAEQFEISDDLSNTFKITEPVILLSTGKDKAAYYKASEDMPLFVNYTIQAYRIKPGFDWISPNYLCYKLEKKAVYATIGITNRICNEFLLKFKIGFPSKNRKEQELIVKEALQQAKLAKAKEMGLQEVIDIMKADYINEVRTRKHDMRPYLRELGSIERIMRKYVSDNSTDSVFQEKMLNLLDKHHEALKHLADLIDIFSEEEKYGKLELFNIDHYFSELANNHSPEESGFELSYQRDEPALNEAGVHDNYTDIAPVDFERLVKNIIENARVHGFTKAADNSYKLHIFVGVDIERGMYQIDFINNGTPLPEGIDKKRYGIRGEKAGITGSTGNGGYVVKSIVEHYKGDYDIFMDDENTVVRILLPISKVYNE